MCTVLYYCHRVATQLLLNIISYHISYIISYAIIRSLCLTGWLAVPVNPNKWSCVRVWCCVRGFPSRPRPDWEHSAAILKADSHIAYRAHAVLLPCRAANGLECLSHLIYIVRPCLIHTCHAAPMHAVLLKATAQHGCRETACGLPDRVRLLPATTRSSTKIVIRSIPILFTTIHNYDCKDW
jgi:hypothetical protein